MTKRWDGACSGRSVGAGRAAKFFHSAIAYAERGFHVFPLQPGDKVPFPLTRGENDATTDATEIHRWARRWPDANIGIVPGKSGLFVVDVDVRNFGDESLRALPPLPATATALTGGGGLHIWFRRPESLDGRKCKALHLHSLKTSGLDIKGVCSGYVVAPPSVHPSGRRYLWEASSHVDELPIADPPAWLVDIIRRSGGRAVEYAPHAVPIDPESFYLGLVFARAGMLGQQVRPGVFAVRCPNERAHHSGKPFDSSTVIFAPSKPGGRGIFFCSHTSECSEALR